MNKARAEQYKIIFCDIDGTLLNSNHQIPGATKQKIQELAGVNVPFILVSARAPSGIWPIQRELGITAPIISYGGALILGEGGDCISSVGICRSKAMLIEQFLKTEWKNVLCSSFCNDYWISDNIHNEWIVREQNITSSVATEGKISDYIPENGHVHKFLCMGKAEEIAALTNAVKEKYPELSVCRSKDTYLEIMDGAVSKSGAVKYLCRHYSISTDEAVSFGDNFNDADMLLATGMSFAMGNAPDEVKNQARYITADNDNEGVLAGINKLNFISIK